MSVARGCTNDDCAMKHKKKKFKPDDLFCPKCGTKLVYVCADCHEPVEKMTYKYCWPCQKRHNAEKEKRKEAARKAVEIVPAAVAVLRNVDPKKAASAAKTVVRIVKR
ncbi:MAG: hypothetical protein IJO69_03310 [Ruminiclostridium sp.]|nr:hypothetical protein [Ruminiclostridium sp.]MBQ9932846.1 hypothetical protein [Ruminiclostridium sp.]